MDFHKFQFFNVIGAAVWVVSLVYGGYLFGNMPLIRDNLGVISDGRHRRGGRAADAGGVVRLLRRQAGSRRSSKGSGTADAASGGFFAK